MVSKCYLLLLIFTAPTPHSSPPLPWDQCTTLQTSAFPHSSPPKVPQEQHWHVMWISLQWKEDIAGLFIIQSAYSRVRRNQLSVLQSGGWFHTFDPCKIDTQILWERCFFLLCIHETFTSKTILHTSSHHIYFFFSHYWPNFMLVTFSVCSHSLLY